MEDQVCTETQNVTFNVEVSHPGIDGIWTFKKQHLKNDSKYKIVTKGKNHSMTVINAMKDEEGQYTFAAGEQTSSAKLTVSGMFNIFMISYINSFRIVFTFHELIYIFTTLTRRCLLSKIGLVPYWFLIFFIYQIKAVSPPSTTLSLPSLPVI